METDVEVKARDYGWVPKEEFKGPEDKWRPAEDFVKWAEDVGRLPKSEFDSIKREFPALKNQNKALQDELGEIRKTLTEFVEFSSKAEERSYARARKDIEAKIEQAAANADPAAARAAMAELDALKPEPKKPERTEQRQETPQIDPVIQDWIAKEDWFNRDRTLNSFATDVFGELEREKPGVSRAEILAETKKRTMDKFPEKFGINPDRDRPAAVGAPSGNVKPAKRGKGYDDLPAEAKVACDKFVKQIPGYTREKYIKDYDWDN